MIFRRGRFRDLIERQLDLFEAESDLLDEAVEADAAWTGADASTSEELYGDYQLVVDAIGSELHGIRETYASTIEERTADDYRREFDARARKRFGRMASFLEDRD